MIQQVYKFNKFQHTFIQNLLNAHYITQRQLEQFMDKKIKQKSYSKKKKTYAPIMLTSKAIQPSQRDKQKQDMPLNIYQNRLISPQKFRTKLSRTNKIHPNDPSLKQDNQKNIINSETTNNLTEQKYQRNHQLNKTFSHSCKKTKFLNVNTSQMMSIKKQSLDQLYKINPNKKFDWQLQKFCLRQPSTSAVVKVQFKQDGKCQKTGRKNNLNNARYNLFLGNSTPNINRNYKSVSTSELINHSEKAQIRDGEDIIVQISDDNSFKLVSSPLNNHQHSLNNRTFQNFLYLKDPNKKLMLSQKSRPFDLTFTNFKQKIYEKKMNKLTNQKTKYNDQWNEYLNKYYLNIRKVKPIMKIDQQLLRDEQARLDNYEDMRKNKKQSRSSAEIFINEVISSQLNDKMSAINRHMQNIKSSNKRMQSQKMQRARSSTLMTSSKTASALSNAEGSPPVSPKKGFKMYNDSDQSKIESDILTKRTIGNRKDYFVFSMGDSSNQSKNQNPILIKFSLYKDFLWKVNYSNGLYVKLPDQVEKPYKFFVGKGNNSSIIKGIMRRRYWWQLVDKIAPDVNFVWTQLRVSDFIKSQTKSKHEQLKLLLDISSHSESSPQFKDKKSNQSSEKLIYQIQKKIFKGNDLSLWFYHLKNNIKHEQKSLQDYGFNIVQKRLKSMIKHKKLTFIDPLVNSSSVTTVQKSHNHFQCNYFIGNKKALFYAMRKYYKLNGLNPFGYIPLTFHISGGLEDTEFSEFLDQYNGIADQRIKNKNSDIKNIWIVKPGEVTNRGRGITVCATLDQIKIRIKAKQKNSDGSLRTYILQKYIQKPFLYQKRKFDIRHYMLMTCINGQIKGYWYQQGYIRTTSTQYNIKNCKDLYTHLTNDAIQKNSSDYGKYEKGNKISYDEFQKYLSKNYKKDYNFHQDILPKMKKLATDAMRATYSLIEPNRRQNNFELFGLDFMLDESMKVYLIECNTNPCLELSCPLLAKIISGLIENVFKICIDPIFPPPYEWGNSKKWQMGDNALQDMKFELVFDQISDGKQLQKLYGTQKGFGNKIGKVQQEQEQYEEDEQQQQEWNQDTNT